MTNDTGAALSGYRVVEFCSTLAGPLATMLMGDQGADVIKVETPAGDQGRQIGHTREGVPNISSMFINVNRNKRSIVLDLKTTEGLKSAQRLVRTADVVVQNFRPGVMDRLGLGYDALIKDNPELIYMSISGLGDTGPGARRRVYDIVVQGLAGFATVQADPETGQPQNMRSAITDKITSLVVWQAATAALLHRERCGVGQHVKVDMLTASLSFLWAEAMPSITLMGEGVKPSGALGGVRYIFPTVDGYIVVGFVADTEFAACCRALELEELIEDPRFDQIGKRFINASKLNPLLAARLAQKSSAHWLLRLEVEDCIYSPVNTAEDILDDPQISETGSLETHTHPVYGGYRQPRHPAQFSASPSGHFRHAPLLGEHTEEVLAELDLIARKDQE